MTILLLLATLIFIPSAVQCSCAPYTNHTQTNYTQTNHTQTYTPVNPTVTAGLRNIVYYGNWDVYARDYQPQDLPSGQLTHLLYAFANFQSNGEVFSSDPYADYQKHYPGDSWSGGDNNAYGCVKQLYIQKKTHRQLKILLSIGGWTYSTNFSEAVSTEGTRATFASSAVALVKNWGFDGIDIDWEYPEDDTDATNYVLLLQALRTELNAYAAKYAPNYHFLLTVASPAGPANYGKFHLSEMATYIDHFHLMAYDYAGSWSEDSGNQANLYFDQENTRSTPFATDKAINDYISAGVPARMIVLGMPLYGRSFESTSGLGEPFTGVGLGSWGSDGVWDYKSLPKAGATEMLDTNAGASYSYDKETMELVSYDNVAMAKQKVAYIKAHGLGGSMFWEVSGDRDGNQSLVFTSFMALAQNSALESSGNLLSYPNSTYANIASGMSG